MRGGDSEWALRQAYPEIQFDWLTFAHGGHGIFAMDYDELMENRAYFEQYVTVFSKQLFGVAIFNLLIRLEDLTS